jgi:hypothetical protein
MLTETGDRKEAYRAYRKLARWKSSRLRDRGLLGAAEVQHLRGRHRSACRHLKTLVETLPESRLVNTAASRQLHWNCRIKKNTD